MHTLPWNFVILQSCGLWQPILWTSSWKINFYHFYTIIITLLIYSFTLFQLIELFGSFDNAENFANGSFMLLTMIGECGKIANLLKKKNLIIELTNVLQNDLCKPRCYEEIIIQDKCNRSARFNTLWYGLLTGMAVTLRTVQSLIMDIHQRKMPFKSWFPYSYDTEIIFWIAYTHQIIAHAVGASVNIAFDTLIPGLLIQICAQIKILKYRLVAIPETIKTRKKLSINDNNRHYLENHFLESELLNECVKHHHEIFHFAKNLNDVFGAAVLLQYSISSIVICVSVYELSKVSLLSTAFATSMLYLACMLAQIFNFCFYGGEITIQSIEISDAVYQMDWSSFSVKTKKNLVTIMMRSLRPITFTCANIITLSLNSFSRLIKLSYSTYNVLQQSGE